MYSSAYLCLHQCNRVIYVTNIFLSRLELLLCVSERGSACAWDVFSLARSGTSLTRAWFIMRILIQRMSLSRL